ncbi:MAG TPA: response regulator [Verrucomicrobiae bacterium]|jgi:CheY-like chemotaxis protein|nr:response regulator [Verrucomicrobiae bacterium]
MTTTDSCVLLLVEDNPDDIFLMRRALKKTGLEVLMHIVTDGRQAIEYLSGTSQYEDRVQFPLPSMIFLDLKLPYLNGFEVLEWIRDTPGLSELDVSILTSSPEDRDKETASRLGARAYLVKPPTSASLLEVLGNLQPQAMTAMAGR